ncbi:MAG: glycosyltransferase family 9 protein [Deltaproteobacteria bacterium]
MKVLIIRFSSIGDIILTSPAVRYAKKNLDAEVHYLTKKENEELLKYNPFIDKIHLYSGNLREILKVLKAENFDYIFDLHNNLRSFFVKINLKGKKNSLNKFNFHKWRMVRLKHKISVPHIVIRYLQTIDNEYDPNFDDHLDFYYLNIENPMQKFNLPSNYCCFSLGAKHNTKKIPLVSALELIKWIDHKIVLIGGNDVVNDANEIYKVYPDKVTNLCAKLSLSESAQVIDKSSMVICSDTGMMHLAAALNKETIVIWGNTVPGFGMNAYYGKNDNKSTNYEISLKCRPCSRIGFDKCPEKHFKCMINHDFKEISKNI